MIFAVAFLGALFAILASLLVVYTYVMLRMLPRLKKSLFAFVEEIGPRALFERSGVDPQDALRELGIDVVAPRGDAAKSTVRVFTCEEHGRCSGCPRVLAQFEAIIRHQGEDTFDEVERQSYAQLREHLGDPARVEEQRVQQVLEALVARGCDDVEAAYQIVRRCARDERASLESWIAAAHNRWRHAAAAFEHEFDGDGADCAICREGRLHYLHRGSYAAALMKDAVVIMKDPSS